MTKILYSIFIEIKYLYQLYFEYILFTWSTLREFFNLLHDHLHAYFFREQHSKFEIRVGLKNIPISLSQHRQFFLYQQKAKRIFFFLYLHSVNFISKVLPTTQSDSQLSHAYFASNATSLL